MTDFFTAIHPTEQQSNIFKNYTVKSNVLISLSQII